MKVGVFGAGPAGLLCAHAAVERGYKVAVYSIKEKSRLQGAQYLHSAIPGLTDDTPDDTITYLKRGTRAGYAKKVYGSEDAAVSWDRFDGEVGAWSLHSAYRNLWDRYSRYIWDGEVRYKQMESVIEDCDVVFSSINPLGYCRGSHDFQWEQVRITDEMPLEDLDDNTIIYNGDPEDDWYRVSRLFGVGQAEYKDIGDKTLHGARIRKPLFSDCDCLSEFDHFHRVGRFGEFVKELLVDDAFRKAEEILDAL